MIKRTKKIPSKVRLSLHLWTSRRSPATYSFWHPCVYLSQKFEPSNLPWFVYLQDVYLHWKFYFLIILHIKIRAILVIIICTKWTKLFVKRYSALSIGYLTLKTIVSIEIRYVDPKYKDHKMPDTACPRSLVHLYIVSTLWKLVDFLGTL